MNDFTKEELEILEKCIILKMDHSMHLPSEHLHQLIDKIQSKIDMYCVDNNESKD